MTYNTVLALNDLLICLFKNISKLYIRSKNKYTCKMKHFELYFVINSKIIIIYNSGLYEFEKLTDSW